MRPKINTQSKLKNQASSQAQTKFQQALELHQKGQFVQAKAIYDEVIKAEPKHFDALHLSGVIALLTNDAALAVKLINRAIIINPQFAVAYNNLATALKALNQQDAALKSYDKAIALKPDFADAHYNRGILLDELKLYEAALQSFDKAILFKPDSAEAYNNRGNTFEKLKQYEDALKSFDKAIALKPEAASIYNNRGAVLEALKQYEAALQSYDQAIALMPHYADAYNNRAKVLKELKQYEVARQSYQKAIELKPDFAAAYDNLGSLLNKLKEHDAALRNFDKAIAFKPDFAEAYCNRGIVLIELKQFDAALQSYGKAIELKPDMVETFFNRGNAFRESKQYQAAIADYDKTVELKSDIQFVYGYRLLTKMHICDWGNTQNEIAELARKIGLSKIASEPFTVLALTDSLLLQRKIAELYVNERYPLSQMLPKITKRIRKDKIRIGYFSGDFRDHPVSLLTAELFEIHDRSKFEVYAFSFGQNTKDEMRRRLEKTFDKFLDVEHKSDKEITQLARSMELDIAIDLGGHTSGGRTGIFAMRAAPIQVSYLGYAGTMGAEYMDYLVADTTLIPDDSQKFYSEKIAYLPNSFMVSDSRRLIANKSFTRAELGLPSDGFVFCCFNNSYKITPTTFDVWMRILKQIDGSVLWLSARNPTIVNNLRKEASARGVSGERLIFAERLPLAEEHLARHRAADLFLDTLPFNAHTTASDALWAGLPVLTCTGESFASRVAASLLNAINMPELITSSTDEYEALAIELARSPERLEQIKRKLGRNRLATPLFDTKLFATHIEDAYAQMVEHYFADLPPTDIYVCQLAQTVLKNSAEHLAVENIPAAMQEQQNFQQALALHQQGLSAQAKALYGEIINANPRHFDALHLSGILVLQAKEYAAAVDLINRAIEVNPQFAAAYSNVATAYKELNQHEAALKNYQKAIELNPDFVDAHYNHGILLDDLKLYKAALQSFDKTILLKPNHAEAYNNRGKTLEKLGQYNSALESFNKAIALKPGVPAAYNNRGAVLEALKQYESALQSYDQAIALMPHFASAYNNRANVLKELKQLDAALQSYKKAIELKPDYANAYSNLGVLFKELGHHEVALQNYDKAIELKNDNVDAHLNRALLLLLLGDFEKGWEGYEWRRKIDDAKITPRNFIQSSWLGKESLEGKTILLYSEQGLGDVIQFCRYAKKVADLGARVILELHQPLQTLLSPLNWVTQLVVKGGVLPTFDYHCPLLSLPLVFKTNLDNIPALLPLPKADANKVSQWQIKLGEKRKSRVGLVWSGSTIHTNDHNRSILLSELLTYLPDDYLYVSLQKELRDTDKKTLQSRPDILHFGDELKDFSDTAALCELMDVIISVDTSVAHLAGALGKQVWILLPFDPDWRWLLDRSDSPWYPTAKLYRQEKIGDWDGVLMTVKKDLLGMNPARTEGEENAQIEKQVQQNFQQALVLHQQGQSAQAKALYAAIISANPRHFDALHLSGILALQVKDYAAAVDLINRAIEVYPQFAPAYSNLATAYKELNQQDAALQNYDKAITLKSDFVDAHYNRGILLDDLKMFNAALQSFDKAILLKPDYAEAYNNRGKTLEKLKQYDTALESFNKAIALKPEGAGAYNNRGAVLEALKQHEAALQSYDQAIALMPHLAGAYNNRGNVLKELKQFDEALQSYKKAIELKPDFVAAYNNYGILLMQFKQYDTALESYGKALALNPDFVETYFNRANALREVKQFQAAILDYDKALALKSSIEFVNGYRLHTKMHICDWTNIQNEIAELANKIELDELASDSFTVLAITDSLQLQYKITALIVNEKCPPSRVFPSIDKRIRPARIRIAYFSADFQDHATARLMAELFEEHDRVKFEFIAFSFGPVTNDEMRKRIANAFDKFIDVRDLSDQEIAQLSRKLEIDIAVDLKGFTNGSRVGIFAYRAAPIQVNYLGYPGTMGAEYIDYLIADTTLIPEASKQYYSEKIAYLPDSYQVNDAKRPIAERVFSRAELGLPNTGFVFCCFNFNYKITPSTFDGWIRILKQVEGSVLWLLEDNPAAADNLRKEAIARGVKEERLIFAKRLTLSEHLARHRAADLFIDTLPCNAHTTASDALWAGLPVLTCTGESFASRVAASLLNAIQLPELITSSQDEYELMAIELATNPDRLKSIKQKLEDNRLATPLFNTKLFARHIEDAYMQMVDRYYADLPPDHIYVRRV